MHHFQDQVHVRYALLFCGSENGGEDLFILIAFHNFPLFSVRGFAKLNKFKKSKNNCKWVGGSRSHSDKKNWKTQTRSRTQEELDSMEGFVY